MPITFKYSPFINLSEDLLITVIDRSRVVKKQARDNDEEYIITNRNKWNKHFRANIRREQDDIKM